MAATELKCPFCIWPVKGGEAAHTCPDCATTYHEDCWVENGACAVFGCPSWARAQGAVADGVDVHAPSSAVSVLTITLDDVPATSSFTASATTVAPRASTPAPPRFCDQCGGAVEAGDRFCGYCGNTLEG